MNWRRLRCVVSGHQDSLPFLDRNSGRLRCQCLRCGRRTVGVDVGHSDQPIDVKRRLEILRGRAQQLRMRVLG